MEEGVRFCEILETVMTFYYTDNIFWFTVLDWDIYWLWKAIHWWIAVIRILEIHGKYRDANVVINIRRVGSAWGVKLLEKLLYWISKRTKLSILLNKTFILVEWHTQTREINIFVLQRRIAITNISDSTKCEFIMIDEMSFIINKTYEYSYQGIEDRK